MFKLNAIEKNLHDKIYQYAFGQIHFLYNSWLNFDT